MIDGSIPRLRLAPKLPATALGLLALLTPLLAVACGGNGSSREQIAFASSRDSGFDIYLINLDGSGEINLTNHPVDDWLPAWSPDGRRIGFSSNRDGNPEIYLMNADGSDVRRLTFNEGRDTHPTWSPDGRRIAFQSEREKATNIYVMDSDGSNLFRVTLPSGQTQPDWSPDGRRIAYADFLDIYVINVDGSGETMLGVPGGQWNPDWSKDGRRIVFSSVVEGKSQIFVFDADGSNPVQVTDGRESARSPSWTADDRIVFDSSSDIFLVNADRTGLINLTNSARIIDLEPSGSP